MGFYIRKYVTVGPLRFNLSKSGIGVSTGIRGLRFGTGTRGNYVHMGRGGLYYRATQQVAKSDINKIVLPTNNNNVEIIESGSVLNMFDSNSADLLKEINAKIKKVKLWPIFAVLSMLSLFWILSINAMQLLIYLSLFLGLLVTIAAYYFDDIRKSVILFYNLDNEIEMKYQKVCDAFNEIMNCKKAWNIEEQELVDDKKYHAGAGVLVKRHSIRLKKGSPAYIKTNIEVPVVPVGKQTLYFFPDKLYVFDNKDVGAVNYDKLNMCINETRFIEEEGLPSDAKVVDQTWKYVNKKGGPDKRFSNNRELPVVVYEEVRFSSDTGLKECIQLSKLNSFDKFKVALEEYLATKGDETKLSVATSEARVKENQ